MNQKIKTQNRLLSLLLALVLVFSMIPMTSMTAYAAADTSAYAPTRKENYRTDKNCIFANGTAITIEAAPNGTRVWYMDGSTKKYVTNNGENGEDLSEWNIFVGSANDDGMSGVNGSVTMTGGTVKCIYAGQYYGGFRGTSNITVIGGTVTEDIYCNSYLSQNSDKVGTVTIFDAVGTTINTDNGGKADNVVQKKDGVWSVTGNGVIPSGVTLTVGSGETLTVPKDATLTNNGSLVNNGTMNLYGPIRGNVFTGNGTVNCYAAYIEGISSVGNISASMNGNTYSLQSGDYYLQSGRLYIWLPNGNAKVTLNGTDYYGVTEAGKQTELTRTYVGMSNVSISEIPSEIGANVNVTLAAKLTGNTTLTPTITYELVSSTAQGATVNGSTLYAAGAGKVTVKVKVSDGYTTKTENFEISVKHTPVTGLSADVPASIIVNAKINLPKVLPSDASYQTITWSIISGQNDTGATVNNGVLTATKKGTFTIRATVENGTAYGKSYTKDFTVKVVALDKESSLDIGAGSITISQNSDGTLKVEYSGFDGDGYRDFAASDLIVITGETEANRVIVKSGSPNVVLHDCKISGSASPFEIQSGATVNLTLNGTNTFQCWGENPGMHVPSGATVVIGGTGTLNVSCSHTSNGGAGIGGKPYQSAGTVIINSGTIIAQGGYGAAGIGGGNGTSSEGEHGGSGGTVTITGGTVTAISVKEGAGIGGGYYGSGGSVSINGGNVKAQGNNASEIGGGYKGSGGTLTDGNENSVSKVTFTLDGMTEATAVTAIEIEGCTYGVNGVSTLDTNKLYFYLPAEANVISVTTESGIYNCKVGNTFYKGHEYSTDCDTTCNRCGDKRDTSGFHLFDDNGICHKTTGEPHFEPAEYDVTNNVYKITNLGNLLWFRDQVNSGNTRINGILTANINAKDEAAKTIGIGTNSNPFEGVFDGNGKTLDIALESTAQYAAPFGYVNGATIIDLTVTGTITSSQKFAASIVGSVKGGTVTLEKCISKVTITSTVSGDGTNGGLVANAGGGVLKINNCAFVGKYVTTTATNSGGFIGWTNKNAKAYITNSYLAADFSEAKTDGSNTFSRNPSYVVVDNCYYVTALSDVPGGATQKTDMSTGEVTWLLNRASTDGVWKQTLGTDTYPNFTGETVYRVQTSCDPATATGYSNEKQTVPAHKFDAEGFCEKCKSFEPATWNGEACVYEIENAGQLYWFAALTNGKLTDGTPQNPAANAVLKKDITVNKNVIVNGALASDTSTFRSWSPIGDYSNNGNKSFAGTFDGNGYTVSGLYASTGVEFLGFVSALFGCVKNLTVADSYFKTTNQVGGIIGQSHGTVEKCATVNCVISGNWWVGGICGVCYDATITNCYSTSILNGNHYAGGISGNTQAVTTIKNCYFAGTNNCNDYKSAITTAVISAKSSKITVENCYYDVKVNPHGGVIKIGSNGTLTTTNVVGVSTDRFKTGEITYLLNGSKSDGVWKQTLGTDTYPNFTGLTVYKNESGYPKYTNHASCSHSFDGKGFCTKCGGYQPAVLNDDVYEISNAAQLFWFAAFVNDGNGTANAVLKADIDLENRAWTPIGQYSDSKPDSSYNVRFEGTFDGNYRTIRNLNVKLTSTYEAGLFSRTYGATLKNFGVVGATVESTQGIRTGVIGGELHNSNLTNVLTAGDITVKTSNAQAGGIAGEASGTTLTNCFTTYGTFALAAGTVTNCYYQADAANEASVGENKTATQYENGELAWILNGETSEGTLVWKQTIGTDAYPSFTGGTVGKYKNCAGSEVFANGTADGVVHTGKYTENGFCENCGKGYEPAVLKDGVYEIGNLGQLMWFASKINSGEITSHTAKLTADIIIDSSVVWKAISLPDHCGSTFDGNNHTITFANTKEGSTFGLFANYNYSTIKNLYLAGSITCNQSGDTSALVNRTYSTTIQNVISTCSVNNSGSGNTGGFTGYFGGGSATIKNSAVYANVTGGGNTGGLIGSIWNGNQAIQNVSNCAYMGTVTGKNNVGALVGYNGNNKSKRSPFTDVYYCETNGLGYLGGTNGGTITATRVEGKTADRFASGEVAYLLQKANGSTLVWGQTSSEDGAMPILTSNENYRVLPVKSGDDVVNYSVLHKGDTNGDGEVTIADYQQLVNIALSDSNTKTAATKYDLNGDGVFDVLDCALAERSGMNETDYKALVSKALANEPVYNARADFDGDGVVDVLDCATAERMLSGHRVRVA